MTRGDEVMAWLWIALGIAMLPLLVLLALVILPVAWAANRLVRAVA